MCVLELMSVYSSSFSEKSSLESTLSSEIAVLVVEARFLLINCFPEAVVISLVLVSSHNSSTDSETCDSESSWWVFHVSSVVLIGPAVTGICSALGSPNREDILGHDLHKGIVVTGAVLLGMALAKLLVLLHFNKSLGREESEASAIQIKAAVIWTCKRLTDTWFPWGLQRSLPSIRACLGLKIAPMICAISRGVRGTFIWSSADIGLRFIKGSIFRIISTLLRGLNRVRCGVLGFCLIGDIWFWSWTFVRFNGWGTRKGGATNTQFRRYTDLRTGKVQVELVVTVARREVFLLISMYVVLFYYKRYNGIRWGSTNLNHGAAPCMRR